MSEPSTAKLFMNGRSQAVRLPKAFRMPGTEVRVTRVGRGVMLEPVNKPTRNEILAIFEEMDHIGGDPILPNGREQPPMPPDDDVPPFD